MTALFILGFVYLEGIQFDPYSVKRGVGVENGKNMLYVIPSAGKNEILAWVFTQRRRTKLAHAFSPAGKKTRLREVNFMRGKKKEPVRKRGIHLHFCVDEVERELIQERIEMTGIASMEAYLRKMAIDGYFITLDLSDVREMVRLLGNATNNINQIARRINETQNIYAADIEDLRKQYNSLWDAARKILAGLAKIK
jgi:hypothetical protein